ncbi:MAG: CPXCG motif-containing cysteine-rich protein [Candidatus Omnitrophica bacterium]|nr:CPXCG motif-containing cysteine-rich protein [Candidatus Omnitrophota bacterium]
MDLERECSFLCPYCSSQISVMVEAVGGKRQAFTIDCEVCCSPILIRIEIGAEGAWSFEAEREGG